MVHAKPQRRQDCWKWYSVRTLYRWIARGKPKQLDSSFLPGATLVEERIVLVKARNGEEALRKAEKEGRAYARSIQWTNGYGQNVHARMLKAVDAYEVVSPPGAGTEVFSTTEEIDASVPDEQICERLIGFGEPLTKDAPWRRFKFVDGKVVRLLLTRSENAPLSCCPGKKNGQ